MFLNFLPNYFKATISGFVTSSSEKNDRFKSYPRKSKTLNKKLLVLKFPKTTPSGLIIGMTFTIVEFKNYST
jgi:hypothetical protein